MTTILASIASIAAGGLVAGAVVFGLVDAQTSAPASSPTDITRPVNIDYGSNG